MRQYVDCSVLTLSLPAAADAPAAGAAHARMLHSALIWLVRTRAPLIPGVAEAGSFVNSALVYGYAELKPIPFRDRFHTLRPRHG